MIVFYPTLTADSFLVKLKNFGLSIRNRSGLKKYPHVYLNSHDTQYIKDVSNWCQENFGDNWIWTNSAQTDHLILYFLHQEDATICALRFENGRPPDTLCVD